MGGTGAAIRDDAAFFEQFRPSLAFSEAADGVGPQADPDSPFAKFEVQAKPATGTPDQMYYQMMMMAKQCGGTIIHPEKDDE